MRWTKLLAIPLTLGVFLLLVVFVSPLLFPAVLHTNIPIWILHLRQRLLPEQTDMIEQPYT